MTSIYTLSTLLAIFAMSELIAQKTKALVSTTLALALMLLIAFWCGLPSTIFQTSGVQDSGIALIGVLILCMGAMMDLPELKRQWKTVVISLVGVISGVLCIISLGGLILGHDMAIAGAPIFAGANVATLIMQKAVADKNMPELATFIVLMLVTQNFIGIPISSILLKKEGKRFLADSKALALYRHVSAASTPQKSSQRKLLQLPELFNTPMFALTKLGLLACVSLYLSTLTGGKIHYFVVTLLMGALASELGLLEKNILIKTQSSAFIIFSTTIIIFASLAKTTPSMLLNLLTPLLISLSIGTLGVAIAGFVMARLLNVSPYLAITLGLTCTYGFPTTMLMPKEIAAALSHHAEEQAALENYLMPKMICAGFVTVTISSVLIASVAANWL